MGVFKRLLCKYLKYLPGIRGLEVFQWSEERWTLVSRSLVKTDFREEGDELSWDDIQTLTAAFVVCILATAAHKGNFYSLIHGTNEPFQFSSRGERGRREKVFS